MLVVVILNLFWVVVVVVKNCIQELLQVVSVDKVKDGGESEVVVWTVLAMAAGCEWPVRPWMERWDESFYFKFVG